MSAVLCQHTSVTFHNVHRELLFVDEGVHFRMTALEGMMGERMVCSLASLPSAPAAQHNTFAVTRAGVTATIEATQPSPAMEGYSLGSSHWEVNNLEIL